MYNSREITLSLNPLYPSSDKTAIVSHYIIHLFTIIFANSATHQALIMHTGSPINWRGEKFLKRRRSSLDCTDWSSYTTSSKGWRWSGHPAAGRKDSPVPANGRSRVWWVPIKFMLPTAAIPICWATVIVYNCPSVQATDYVTIVNFMVLLAVKSFGDEHLIAYMGLLGRA